MSYLDFYNKLDYMEEKEFIQNYLIYSASLVIAGVKPSATITLKKYNDKIYKNWIRFGREFLDEIKLKFIELRETKTSIIVLIYDEKILIKELSKSNVFEYLVRLGYSKDINIDIYVKTLKFRYEMYHCPHELGLFLGIPFEDVKDFMECTEKKCLLCGYWKVYNDANKAKFIFNKYDEVKDFTKKRFVEGTISKDLVLKIRENFYRYIFI